MVAPAGGFRQGFSAGAVGNGCIFARPQPRKTAAAQESGRRRTISFD